MLKFEENGLLIEADKGYMRVFENGKLAYFALDVFIHKEPTKKACLLLYDLMKTGGKKWKKKI